MKILLTGGSGLLGKELLRLDKDLIAPSRNEMDVTSFESVNNSIIKNNPDIIIHCAAATKPMDHNTNPELGLLTNIIGTSNVCLACIRNKKRIVYTSTDYVYTGSGPHREDESLFSPYNFGWSKLGGECSVRLVPNHLILRLSFGPVPFPWEVVYKNQFNSKLYVDEIAPLVLKASKSNSIGVMNIGGPVSTLEDYAKRTKPEIKTVDKPDWVPGDTSLNVERMISDLDIKDLESLIKHK